MEEPELAKEHQIFTPTMVIAGNQRIIAPIEQFPLKRMIVEQSLESWPRNQIQPSQQVDKIVPLTTSNNLSTCWLCLKGYIDIPEMNKSNWTLKLSREMGKDFFGYIGVKTLQKFMYTSNEYVAAIEILPASYIPYPIPDHEETTAFITCVHSETEFSSYNDEGDYRQHMIEHAIENLPKEGFEKIQVIAGATTAYPNGPSKIFTDLGFKKKEVLQQVELIDGPEDFILLEYIL